MSKYFRFALTSALLAMIAPNHGIAADGLTLGMSTEYTSGKYGGPDHTTIASIPLFVKYASGPLTLRMSVSWISITGNGTVIPSGLGGIGGVGSGDASGGGGTVGTFGCAADNRSGARRPEDNGPCTATTAPVAAGVGVRRNTQGMGDVVMAATYNVLDRNNLAIDVSGKVKFATASDTRGLGSGKNDYALQVVAEKGIGKAYIHGGVGFKWLGDPTGVSLRNPVYGSFGGGYKLGETTLGATYDAAQAARNAGINPQEITLYASQRLTKAILLNANLYKGLSRGSPDWGAGIGLGYRY